MYKHILFLFFNFFFKVCLCQVCNCRTNIDSLIKIVEENYAGYHDRIVLKKEYYVFFKDSVIATIGIGQALDYACYLKLKKFLKFFNDPHLSLSFNVAGEKRKISRFFKQIGPFYLPKKDYTCASADIEKLQGLWTDESGSFDLRLVAVKNDSLAGYVIKGDGIYYHKNHVKVEIKRRKTDYFIRYYLRDRTTITDSTANISSEIKVFSQLPLFKKELASARPRFVFKRITNSTGYLKFPNFFPENFKIADSIIKEYEKVQPQLEHLIIDVRNNAGGSALAFLSLVPYFYTDSILYYGSYVRSSPENIKMFIKISGDTLYPHYTRNFMKSLADTLKKYPDSMYRLSKSTYYKLDSIYSNPEKVAVLINDRCFSAGEFFAYFAANSKKCTLIGKETYGALNYTGVNSDLLLPCRFIKLNYPTEKSERADIKTLGRGIKPHIELKTPEQEWINYAVQYLEQ